jgi:hypothetical protein
MVVLFAGTMISAVERTVESLALVIERIRQ